MKIGILDCGPLAAPLSEQYGSYAAMIEALISSAEPGFSYQRYVVYEGELPASAEAADGWIISGSRHGAYDPIAWIAPLEDLIREIATIRRPLAGICFGHQIMAQALGGRVEKSDKGWGLGLSTYSATSEAASLHYPFPATSQLIAVHQDQVVAVPPGSHVLARSAHCEIAALCYGDLKAPYAISVQPHPEFSTQFVVDLIDARLRESLPKSDVDAAMASLGDAPDQRDWAHIFSGFFSQARLAAAS